MTGNGRGQVTAPDYVREEPNDALRTLLLQADQRREQRQWGRAQALCLRLLRKHPDSAAAHALMGDVFRDQGRNEDAIEWYQLALELRDIPDLRRRLEPLLRARGEQAEPQLRRPPVAMSSVGMLEGPRVEYTVGGPAAEETWLRRHGLVLGISGAVVLVIVGMLALALSLAGKKKRPPTVEETAIVYATPPQGGRVAPAATARPSTSPGRASTAPSRAQIGRPRSSGPSRSAAPTSSSRATPPGRRATFDLTSTRMRRLGSTEDQVVLRRLSEMSWPDGSKVGSSVDALIDLPKQEAIITFQVPESVAHTELRKTVLVQSFRFAREAFEQHRGIEQVTVRALFAVGGKAEEGARNVVAFRGSLARDVVTPYGQREPGVRDLGAGGIFGEIWWHSDIARLLRAGGGS